MSEHDPIRLIDEAQAAYDDAVDLASTLDAVQRLEAAYAADTNRMVAELWGLPDRLDAVASAAANTMADAIVTVAAAACLRRIQAGADPDDVEAIFAEECETLMGRLRLRAAEVAR